MLALLALISDWEIPWAGIGAILMGIGSLLSGLGAYRAATRKPEHDEPEAESRPADR